MPGEHLDLSSEPQTGPAPAASAPRSYLGLHFTCCRVYARVFLTQDGTAFAGHCPRCGGSIRLEVSETGVSGRFFSAG